MSVTTQIPARSARWPLLTVLAILLVEFTFVGTIFKYYIDFECSAHWPEVMCSGASKTLVACYCLLGVGVLLRMLRPQAFADLTEAAGQRLWPAAVNSLGVLVSLVPITFLNGAEGASGLVPSLGFWAVGMALMLLGMALYLAPVARWRRFWAMQWTAIVPAVVLASITPWASIRLQPIWSVDWIADNTFVAVTKVMGVLGYDIVADPADKVIGADGFFVQVSNYCSGIEGIALVTLFVSLYLWLFRSELRFPLALLLYPIGIAASVVFNILRISVLLVIGLEGNPELAVNAFHSHAGWLMFTIVSLGLIALAQLVPALRKSEAVAVTGQGATLPPFFRDPVVAQILPFVVFMFSALLASTLSQTPSLVYPLRVLAMVAAVAAFVPVYMRLDWKVDPISVGVGLVIAAYWILIPVAEEEAATAPYGALSGGLLVLWFAARGLGTIVLVPVIEEFFFRGYLERRLRIGSGLIWAMGASVVTAVLFAALHGRWAEAFVAGLLFSWVAARRGRVTDAVIAHAVANGVIFAAAVATNNQAMI